MKNRWAIIINPKSGKRRFRLQCDYLFNTLKKAGIEYEYYFTEYEGHAVAITKNCVDKKVVNFLVVGGDGTFSEIVNGIFLSGNNDFSNFKLAIIPRGTGNDWGRFWGLTRDYKQSIDVFLSGKSKYIDVGSCAYNIDGKENKTFFVNTIGLGLDAKIVDLTHQLKKYVGSYGFLYSVSLLIAAFTFRAVPMTVESENIRIEKKIFTVSIANGCYTGGGLKQTPNAVPYDGLFDIMVADSPKFWDVITALTRLFKGSLLNHPIIHSFQTKEITITSNNNLLIESDGICLYAGNTMTVKIIPQAIRMIIP